MDTTFGGILLFLGFLIGMMFGWLFAHSTISTECQKLNSFYVGDKVYNCEIRK